MRVRRVLIWCVTIALVVGFAAALSGCGGGTSTTTTGGTTAQPMKIALLLPETKTARYETQDRPLFEAKVKELAPDAEILYSNANQDAAQQQSQADAALTNGANVLVLDPVDSASAASIVTKAAAQKVPVISYDRLILNAPVDYYISFDNEKVGTLQGQALLDKLTADGNAGKTIVMINGSPTDNNATLFKKGAHSVLDGKVKIGAEYDTPDWSPDKAQTEMDQAITKLGKDGFVGVSRCQRRHRRRRDRCHEGRRHRPEDQADDRPGRRTRRYPAHPSRRAVHDRLQGDQARGRGGRRAGRRAGQGRDASVGHDAQPR